MRGTCGGFHLHIYIDTDTDMCIYIYMYRFIVDSSSTEEEVLDDHQCCMS